MLDKKAVAAQVRDVKILDLLCRNTGIQHMRQFSISSVLIGPHDCN